MLTMIGNLIPWRGKVGEDEESASGTAITRFHSEVDRLFDRFLGDPFGGSRFAPLWREGVWPSIDISDTEDALVVTAEVPGVDAEDLDISVSGDMLTLSGQKKEQREERREGFYHSERRFGSFRRTVTLPVPVNREEITAECRDGVLRIRLPKSEGATPKRIPVTVSRNK